MKITIVGVGEVGTYYAEHWSQAGHDLVLTFYRDQAKVERLAARLGERVSFTAPEHAVADADVVLFSPRFEHIELAAEQIGDVGEAILIDANNPFNPERNGVADLAPNETASTLMTRLFPHARHVKAFHNLGIQTIRDHAEPLVAFVASDDANAAKAVMTLASQAQLTPLLTGGLATAPLSEFPGPLFGIPFATLQSARDALAEAVGEVEAK